MNHKLANRLSSRSSAKRSLVPAAIVSGVAALGFVMLSMILGSSAAIASEQVVLKYSAFQRSVQVADLAKFAETGEMSRPLRAYVRMSGEDPKNVRETLTKPVAIDAVTLDRVLNSFAGEALLSQLSQYVYTRSSDANVPALRSAMVLSASDDNQITLLELLQKYPTKQVLVNGNRLLAAYNEIQSISEKLKGVLGNIHLF
jgi:Alpha/beta hydrolase of unknown function (DUF1400)